MVSLHILKRHLMLIHVKKKKKPTPDNLQCLDQVAIIYR